MIFFKHRTVHERTGPHDLYVKSAKFYMNFKTVYFGIGVIVVCLSKGDNHITITLPGTSSCGKRK